MGSTNKRVNVYVSPLFADIVKINSIGSYLRIPKQGTISVCFYCIKL